MFCCYLKQALHEKIFLDADVFVSKKKGHVDVAFKIPISEYSSFDKLIDFICKEWEKRKIFFCDYKMIYPRLISSLKWKFDYVFFEKKSRNGKQRVRKAI